MVKKIAVACLCMAALGSSLDARELSNSKTFIGLELESTQADTSTQVYLNSATMPPFKTSGDAVGEYGFNIGVEDEEWRTTFLYTYYNNDDKGAEETMNKGSLLVDYFIWTSSGSDYEIKPYIGAHIGYMSYEMNADLGYGNQILADESDIFYGGQVGVAMTVSEVIGLDLSYKYSGTNLTDMPTDFINENGDTLHFDTSLDNMRSIAFGIKYFY